MRETALSSSICTGILFVYVCSTQQIVEFADPIQSVTVAVQHDPVVGRPFPLTGALVRSLGVTLIQEWEFFPIIVQNKR
jgi:hypothetical protein